MNKIEREKRVLSIMFKLYCRHNLGLKEMPDEYRTLYDYACRRLDSCKWGVNKPTCKRCSIHCYAKKQREDIRRVMRWTGRRMIFYAPLLFFEHLLHKR